jgi:hypothetical protein
MGREAPPYPDSPQEDGGGPAFAVVPDLRRRMEVWSRGWALFQVQAGRTLAYRFHGPPSRHGAAVPAEEDGAPEIPPAGAQAASDSEGLAVARLDVAGEAPGVAFRGPRERGQRRDPSKRVMGGDAGECPAGAQVRRRVGMSRKPLAARQAREAPKWRPVFYGRPLGAFPIGARARHAAAAGAPAPGTSSPPGARPASHGPGESAPQTAPAARQRSASRSTARWGSHGPWPPAAPTAATAGPVGRSPGAAAPVPAWGLRPPRPRAARPAATETRSAPRPGAGAPPRVSSFPAPGVPRRGVGAVPTCGVSHTVSWDRAYHCSFIYATVNTSLLSLLAKTE